MKIEMVLHKINGKLQIKSYDLSFLLFDAMQGKKFKMLSTDNSFIVYTGNVSFSDNIVDSANKWLLKNNLQEIKLSEKEMGEER